MLMTLKCISALLSYPSDDLQAAIGDIRSALRSEGLLDQTAQSNLEPLLAWLGCADVYELQESFVHLFDRSRTLSLNLFEHVHGESRDRGGAMVDLVETYRDGGFEPATSELPDHLPVLLEFLATRPLAEAKDTLADAAHIFEVLQARLERRKSNYAAVFAGLLLLSGRSDNEEAVATMLEEPDDNPDDLDALDAVWEEAQVAFGPDPDAGCPQVRDMLANMDTPVNPAPVSPARAV
jgi:nitrate reductase molybdenum cofactor assembly chaperone NarJ/NarW